LHDLWLSYYCRPAVWDKQKTHRRAGSGFDKVREQSTPGCRAGKQRVHKQQVQIAIHRDKISRRAGQSNKNWATLKSA